MSSRKSQVTFNNELDEISSFQQTSGQDGASSSRIKRTPTTHDINEAQRRPRYEDDGAEDLSPRERVTLVQVLDVIRDIQRQVNDLREPAGGVRRRKIIYLGTDLLEVDATDVSAYARDLAITYFWSEEILKEKFIPNGRRSLRAAVNRTPFQEEADIQKIRILKAAVKEKWQIDDLKWPKVWIVIRKSINSIGRNRKYQEKLKAMLEKAQAGECMDEEDDDEEDLDSDAGDHRVEAIEHQRASKSPSRSSSPTSAIINQQRPSTNHSRSSSPSAAIINQQRPSTNPSLLSFMRDGAGIFQDPAATPLEESLRVQFGRSRQNSIDSVDESPDQRGKSGGRERKLSFQGDKGATKATKDPRPKGSKQGPAGKGPSKNKQRE